jgi:hypothetical protein
MQPTLITKDILQARKAKLEQVKEDLKKEFFGLDSIIDRVVNAITAWYIFPQIIVRPVVINLWGMTGVGKTQLIRRLVHHLEMADKFVEIQLDGGSGGSVWNSTLSSVLGDSVIEEGTPGILLLDEVQRFRTVADNGEEIRVERYMDVWPLLSDGKFSSDSGSFQDIEMMLLNRKDRIRRRKLERDVSETSEDTLASEEPDEDTGMGIWAAQSFKRLLHLTEPISEIMHWDDDRAIQVLQHVKRERKSWETDYSKLLIFIAGNLDSAFPGSHATYDSDTDADYYHELTKKITINEIKYALGKRFKPEQIARFGNHHIIYPSLSKSTYQSIIRNVVQKYTVEMEAASGVALTLDERIYDKIYENSVFPTQGTRPVFSSIHKIMSTLMVDVAFWCLTNEKTHASIILDELGNNVRGVSGTDHTDWMPLDLELDRQKDSAPQWFKQYVAVHEAAHAVVYMVLFGQIPHEIRTNAQTMVGGFMTTDLDAEDKIRTKAQFQSDIAVCLGGYAGESIIFGAPNISQGSKNDIAKATTIASNMVRNLGFVEGPVRIDSAFDNHLTHILDAGEYNPVIRSLMLTGLETANTILRSNFLMWQNLVAKLLEKGFLTKDEIFALLTDLGVAGVLQSASNPAAIAQESITKFLP